MLTCSQERTPERASDGAATLQVVTVVWRPQRSERGYPGSCRGSNCCGSQQFRPSAAANRAMLSEPFNFKFNLK
jgi:hypothetical protein